MKKLLVTLAIAPAFAALPALAEPGHLGPLYGHAAYYEQHNSGVDERQARQRAAIERGIARGAITRHEAHRLFSEQARIARAERMARSDGRFTPAERARLQHLLDESERHIRLAIYDRDRRHYY